ncbi:MAG TPA: prepilin-type N-terminal cleavage/methylation domain-containing protein, partial [Tepidisphaeraceae bacterium]|nr:prepilin-type N-terminal cleavage/methylation domain-containing protein [Tepidisphaeraceae bacterium]
MLHPTRRYAAFTLIELLVVIGIIGLLTGILIPIVGRVRMSVRTASTQALLSQLSGACDRYYTDFHAYPGPFSNDQIFSTTAVIDSSGTHFSN